MNKSQHVVPNRHGDWAVHRSGASRASRVFSSRKDALDYARKAAKREGSILYLHRNDGMVMSRESFMTSTRTRV
jgi:hypothetical protein